MQRPIKVDYTKLLGFATVGDHLSTKVDLQDETLGAKLGAKVGTPEDAPPRDADK